MKQATKIEVGLFADSRGQKALSVPTGQVQGTAVLSEKVGFGLSSAPKIMTVVLKTVLKKDCEVDRATSSYIDDIFMEEAEVTAEVRDNIEDMD